MPGRRGMRYVMWTLLATFLFNGIGIILYFILREPLLGLLFEVRFACQSRILPTAHRCGSGLQPACPACHRVIQGPWAPLCRGCGNKSVAK